MTTDRDALTSVLMEAWAKAEPEHPVTLHPASYVATFVDLARAADAEIRARVSDEVRAMGHGDYFHGPAWEQVDAAEYCGRCSCAEEFADRIIGGTS